MLLAAPVTVPLHPTSASVNRPFLSSEFPGSSRLMILTGVRSLVQIELDSEDRLLGGSIYEKYIYMSTVL